MMFKSRNLRTKAMAITDVVVSLVFLLLAMWGCVGGFGSGYVGSRSVLRVCGSAFCGNSCFVFWGGEHKISYEIFPNSEWGCVLRYKGMGAWRAVCTYDCLCSLFRLPGKGGGREGVLDTGHCRG